MQRETCILLVATGVVISAGAMEAHAAFIGGLDGVSLSSTFETGAIAPLPALGWTALSGTPRIFDAAGLNGVLINGTPYGNYAVQYLTGAVVEANTRYTLSFDMGFVANLTGGSATYMFDLGLWDGSIFTSLGSASTGTVNFSGNFAGGRVSGSASQIFETGNIVGTGVLAVRWTQTSTAGVLLPAWPNQGLSDYFGFDNVRLDAVPRPSMGVTEPRTDLLVAIGCGLLLAGVTRRSGNAAAMIPARQTA